MYTIKNNLLFKDGKQVPYVVTPNKSKGTMKPEYLIQHYTAAANAAGTISWFKNKDAQASAHLLIDRDGKVTQFGAFNEILWHAGKSSWKSYTSMNSHSIGIELVNMGRSNVAKDGYVKLKHKNEATAIYWQTYPEAQIKECKEISDCLVNHYKLLDVLGHEDIAPGRKSDPGPAFPWDKIKTPTVTKLVSKFTTADLNVRLGPSTEHKAVTVLKKGTEVNILDTVGEWSHIFICSTKITGFVSNKYLK